jgi:hypothetical protein
VAPLNGGPPLRLRRIALLSASALAAINIWTGAPLLALWAGSQVQRGRAPSMAAVFVVLLVLAACCLVLLAALSWLSARYDRLTGRPAAARRTSPWLRSMRGEREEIARTQHGISAVERVVVIAVVVCVLVFEVWFFFFAGSPLPSQ